MSVQQFCQGMPLEMPTRVTSPSDGPPSTGILSKRTPAATVTSSARRVLCDGSTTPALLESARLTGPVTMTELRCARAVHTKHDPAGQLRVILDIARGRLLASGKTV